FPLVYCNKVTQSTCNLLFLSSSWSMYKSHFGVFALYFESMCCECELIYSILICIICFHNLFRFGNWFLPYFESNILICILANIVHDILNSNCERKLILLTYLLWLTFSPVFMLNVFFFLGSLPIVLIILPLSD
ncbi:hypothetical protein ACJX0J_020258, partial [Zea mays]